MKYVASFLLILSISNFASAATEKTICPAIAPSEEELTASVEKLCLTAYKEAGVPTGTVDLTYFTKEQKSFAKLSYRYAFSFEPQGTVTLTLTERSEGLFAESFDPLRVVILKKLKDDGKGNDIGTISMGKTEGDAKFYGYYLAPR
jgi:hypothetical protein